MSVGSLSTSLSQVLNGKFYAGAGERPADAAGDSCWQRQRTNFSGESMAVHLAAVHREVLPS